MPINAQPSGRRGTVGHPYSALNLRLVLAGFGLVVSVGLAVLSFRLGYPVPGWAGVVLAAVAAVDLVVIQLRRRARRRASDEHHSLFE
jgi:hypothetical protein